MSAFWAELGLQRRKAVYPQVGQLFDPSLEKAAINISGC
jgi:hypothetical protein